MRNRLNPVEALVQLPQREDHAARQASWRQAIAALAQSAGSLGPPPLDGVDQRILESSAHIAVETGLADDLDWIAPGSAAVALYELSSGLPAGKIKRDLRRRVFSRLYEGTASAFATVASRMALGNAAPLELPTLRARVALCFDLPIGSTVNAAPLALALATRRELQKRWLDGPSTQALPARRLAAQLLEHAARGAVVRYQLGDSHPLDLLLGEEIRPTLRRLLLDREPLVWQHAAVARGLLASVSDDARAEVESALDPTLTPTEWRRGGVSLVASLIGDEDALRSCRAVIEGSLAEQDPGLIATLPLGLPRVIEAEPDRAEELLDRLARTRRGDVAESVAALLANVAQPDFALGARTVLQDALSDRARDQPAVLRALSTQALHQLTPEYEDEEHLGTLLRRALQTFDSEGAKRAYQRAVGALAEAHQAAEFVETHDPIDQTSIPSALATLQDLDTSVIERPTLINLLLLGVRPGETDASVPAMERLYNRVSNWVVAGVEKAGTSDWSRDSAIADQRRLRVLLHLVDAESATASGDGEQKPILTRLRRSIVVLLNRLSVGPDAMVHRVLCATLARSFDAAVREGVAQASDLALVVASALDDNYSVATIAEASTNPDVSGPIGALSEFMNPELMDPANEQTDTHTGASIDPGALARGEVEDLLRVAGRVIRLSQGLSGGGGYRSEALRRVVFRLGRALESVAACHGLTELVEAGSTGAAVIDELEGTIEAFTDLMRSARRRLLDATGDVEDFDITAGAPPLSALLERAVRGGVPANADQLALSIEGLSAPLPSFLGRAVEQVLHRLRSLPVHPDSDVYALPLQKRRAPLPDWLLPRRTIGSFYVVRALGAGGVSSVFLARRHEERHEPKAEAFALKVPEYDPTTARSLSEQEFLQLFRDEAGALLSLPAHENLARFVTFDLAARPKPILVMELIKGTPLDRLVRTRSLTADRVMGYLDGILAGLEAMHQVGVGHLDVKPSNVILRAGKTPVLVDFGLSGRQLRPGCGTLEYTAPEVLGVVADGATPTPPAADIYAFCCMAFEMLTGELLFDADDELTLVSNHVGHDGWPDKLAQFSEKPELRDLGLLIASGLRRDPTLRPTASKLRARLNQFSSPLSSATWPLRPEASVRSA